MIDRLRAVAKYALSFFKTTWTLDDYPIRFVHQPGTGLDVRVPRTAAPWRAEIINWWQMAGSGDSKGRAYQNLKRNLATYWSEHGALPRPGSRVALEFAASDAISRYEEIARDFLPRVLNISFESCLLTDESSLADFEVLEPGAEYTSRIKELYGIEVEELPDAKLVSIFRRIHASRTGSEARM